MSERRLRIGVDARPLSLPMTGITRYTWELLQRLVMSSNHEWYLYLSSPPVHPLPQGENVQVRQGSFAGGLGSQIFSQIVFPSWARRDRLDVYWSPRHHLPLRLPRNIRTLLTIHDLVWECYPETMSRSGLWAERLLMPSSLKRADAIVTVSEATRRDVCEFMPGISHRTSSIHSGLTKEQQPCPELLPDQQLPYFLFVGTLEPRKNLERLLQSFARAEIKATGVRLLIVGGEGWGNLELASLVYELKLEKRVTLVGRVDDETELASYYSHAIALVMPSLYEGFGLPLLEAMGQGTPVITSDRGAMAEVVGDGGVLVNPEDEKTIAHAMLTMMQAETRRQYAEQALQRSGQFDWDQTAQAILQQIEAL